MKKLAAASTAPGTATALSVAIGVALALDDAARSEFARRAMAHIASGYTSELMCARTIAVYEELLFPEAASAVEAQARELLAVPA